MVIDDERRNSILGDEIDEEKKKNELEGKKNIYSKNIYLEIP